VIDHLCDPARERYLALAELYYDSLSQHEQSTTNMLGAILKQLANRGEIPEHVGRTFRTAREGFGGRSLRLPDLLELLKTTIPPLPRLFICIDTLNEALSKLRLDLLRFERHHSRFAKCQTIPSWKGPYSERNKEGCFSRNCPHQGGHQGISGKEVRQWH